MNPAKDGFDYEKALKSFPKIGIRPVIDMRYDVRAALEERTMTMAKKTADFLTDNLRYVNGAPVECVIADTTISGVVEATQADEKFRREGVGLSITVTPSWCNGAETMDMDPLIPKAVWGFNGSERSGAVYLAAVLAAHDQKGLPAFKIYGKNVQDADDTNIPEEVQTKLLNFAKAGLAVAYMRGKSYLSMGGMAMGIAGSIVNPDFLEAYLGLHYEMVDMSEFIRRIEEQIYDPEEFQLALNWVKQNCKEGPDYNHNQVFTPEKRCRDWEFVVKMALIARDLMIGNPKLAKMGYSEEAMGHKAIVAGFQGQRQWTDHFPNSDFLETILNSSFDWNGRREPFIIATENDHLNGIGMLFGHLLTNTAQIFSDVRTFWSAEAVQRIGGNLTGLAKNGFIHLVNSGPATLDGTGRQSSQGKPIMKPFWEITEDEVKQCLDAAEFCPTNLEISRGGGFSTKFITKGGMPATMFRINIVKTLGPVLQIAEGYTVDLEPGLATAIINRTGPSRPTTWFVPRLTGKGPFKDVYSVMDNWGANHAAVSYGHIGSELITLAAMLRIPVCMHNVAEDMIFRPCAWNSYGTVDVENADFRACADFGPLYG
jgi:L-fucose isomerase